MTHDDDDDRPRADDHLTVAAGDHASPIQADRSFARLERSLVGLCGEQDPGSLWLCTRAVDHDGDHIAGIGPYVRGEHILARWSR